MLAWLLTYLVHSTVLIAITALVARFLDDRHLALEETLWRLAAFGGVVTASAQLGLGVGSLAGTFSLGTASIHGPGATLVPTGTTPPRLDGVMESASSSLLTPSLSSLLGDWLVLGWICGACLLTSALVFGYLRLAGRLRDRHRVDGGLLFRMLTGLLETSEIRRPIELTASRRIAIPLVWGWWHREICLPERALRQLPAAQQENILAHELAHLERSDPLWLVVQGLLESVLFPQPLNRLVRLRLQEIAEFRCDDRAVARTGRPLTMARCLADVAEWSLKSSRPTPTPALASRGRGLRHRVARLLDCGYPPVESRRPAWIVPFALALLCLTVVTVPGFSVARPETPSAPQVVTPPDRPEPPTPPQPVEPVTPVPPVPALPSLTEIKARELASLRHSPEMETRLMAERLDDQVRNLERVAAAELERLADQTRDLERATAKEIERLDTIERQSLRRDRQATAERQLRLRQAELRELRDEQRRIQEERQDRLQSEQRERRLEQQRLQRDQRPHREEPREQFRQQIRDPEAPADPPS